MTPKIYDHTFNYDGKFYNLFEELDKYVLKTKQWHILILQHPCPIQRHQTYLHHRPFYYHPTHHCPHPSHPFRSPPTTLADDTAQVRAMFGNFTFNKTPVYLPNGKPPSGKDNSLSIKDYTGPPRFL